MAVCHEVIQDLDEFRVKKAPNTAYYVPNFVTESEEAQLLHEIYSAPKPRWTQLSRRRLQNWGGLPHSKGMIQEDLPQWLNKYAVHLGSYPVFHNKIPNHVIVNEYEPGQGIMPHEDGPLFYPVVSTISLGSHTILNFYRHIDGTAQQSTNQVGSDSSLGERHCMSLLLEPRSLLLLTQDLYQNYLHGIEARAQDTLDDKITNMDLCSFEVGQSLTRSRRVSLTIRHVQKTLKVKLKFGK